MIKVFQKIQKLLLIENKISKYLLYAIGEIALVMIGILLALQVNNWNTERLDKIELGNYLLKIANNIDQDIMTISKLTIRRDSVFFKAKRSAKLIMNEDYSQFSEVIGGFNGFFEFYFSSNKSGFEAFKNSHYLGRIRDSKIDSLLTLYYDTVEKIEKNEISYNTFIENMEVNLFLSIDFAPMYRYIQSQEFQEDHDDIDFQNKDWIERNQKDLQALLRSKPFKAAVFRSALQDDYINDYRNLIKIGQACIFEIRSRVNSD